MSYNIHSGYGMDDKLDIDRISDTINKQSPDILAIQEAEWESTRSIQRYCKEL